MCRLAPKSYYLHNECTMNPTFDRLQCSLPTKCAGRQNSCAWWRRASLLLDQAGCLKARRLKPFKVGFGFTSSTVALFFLALTCHFYYHFQILGYTLLQTRSLRGSGVSVSAGLFERLPRRPCSRATRFTQPSRWFLLQNS